MSQAPYALRDARFGTKLGLDLKVSFPLDTFFIIQIFKAEWCPRQKCVFRWWCSSVHLQLCKFVLFFFFFNVITILKLIFQVVQVIKVKK